MTIDIEKISEAISLLATVTPQVLAAYNALKVIWLNANSGKTEADFLAMLDAASQQNIDDATAILIRDGYSLDAGGNWVAPATT